MSAASDLAPGPKHRRQRSSVARAATRASKTLPLANTLAWSGAQALFSKFDKPLQPQRPDFMVLLEHRKARTQACEEAEDWAQDRSYNLTQAAAKATGVGPLQTSGGVAIGACNCMGLIDAEQIRDVFSEFPRRVHTAVVNCASPSGVLRVPTGEMALT